MSSVTDTDIAISAISSIVDPAHEQLFENITEALNGSQELGNPVEKDLLDTASQLVNHLAFPHVIIALARLINEDVVKANSFAAAAEDTLAIAEKQRITQDTTITDLNNTVNDLNDKVTTLEKHLSDTQSTLADANSTLVTTKEAFTKFKKDATAQIRALKKAVRLKVNPPKTIPLPDDDEDENDMSTPKSRTSKDPDAFTGEGSTAVKRAEAYRAWRAKIELCWFQDSWYFSQDERYKFAQILQCLGGAAFHALSPQVMRGIVAQSVLFKTLLL
ncbi:hypothetical protein N0V85_009794 [Neurospora sp. IMI 360204]|nr:hypothetical protein N0V85_009794 [Neurospora sp. IMI 360204]